MRWVRITLPPLIVAGCLAGCGATGSGTRAASTSTVTTSHLVVRRPPRAVPVVNVPRPGYLNPQTLARALVIGYNRTPPLTARARSASCVVDQTTDTATCTLRTNKGPAVEPVAIADDGSNFQASPPSR